MRRFCTVPGWWIWSHQSWSGLHSAGCALSCPCLASGAGPRPLSPVPISSVLRLGNCCICRRMGCDIDSSGESQATVGFLRDVADVVSPLQVVRKEDALVWVMWNLLKYGVVEVVDEWGSVGYAHDVALLALNLLSQFWAHSSGFLDIIGHTFFVCLLDLFCHIHASMSPIPWHDCWYKMLQYCIMPAKKVTPGKKKKKKPTPNVLQPNCAKLVYCFWLTWNMWLCDDQCWASCVIVWRGTHWALPVHTTFSDHSHTSIKLSSCMLWVKIQPYF